jgi:hypothetical protein
VIPNGTGLTILIKGRPTGGNIRKQKIEILDRGVCGMLTGASAVSSWWEIEERQEELDILCRVIEEYDDPDQIAERFRIKRADGRVWVRFATREDLGCARLAVACTIEQPDTGWFGRLWDISLGGAAVLLTQHFGEGSMLVLELSDPATGDPRRFLANVAYSRREGGRGWLIGCEFLRPLSQDELRALVGE